MSQSSSWDDMQKAREGAYFYQDEQEKILALKRERAAARAYLTRTHEVINNFNRGFSPLGGGRMFKAHIGDDVILDCPEEGTMTIPYDTMEALLKDIKNPESNTLKAWEDFLKMALSQEIR